MPQVRISEVAYRELKARAKREKRTLSAVIERLLLPTDVDREPTPVDRAEESHWKVCSCPAEMVKKGRHLKKCPLGMRGK